MIDRFTAKAREAISLAVDAAKTLGHNYVGTEHLLIGLLQEGCSKEVFLEGSQPSCSRAFEGSPQRLTTSVGR